GRRAENTPWTAGRRPSERPSHSGDSRPCRPPACWGRREEEPARDKIQHDGRNRMTVLLSLSNDLAAAVEGVSRSIVAVHARPRMPSTGIHWRPGIIVTADHTVRIEDEIRIAGP